jgi:hypothetical protein
MRNRSGRVGSLILGEWRLPMIVRLSQKLSTRIKAGKLPAEPLHENPLVDWSAHLFVTDRTQYILVSNTRSLYSVVMYGQGVTNDDLFIKRALDNLRDCLNADGQSSVYERFIAPSSGLVRFAKASDRAVTGSMNELIASAKALLVMDELSPFDVGPRLNDILLSSIAKMGEKYGKPREAFKSLVSGLES